MKTAKINLQLTMAILALFVTSATFLYANDDNRTRNNERSGWWISSLRSNQSTTLTFRTIWRLLLDRQALAELQRLPAFNDGRLSFEDLVNQARRTRVVEPLAPAPSGDPGEAVATAHLTEDDRLVYLTAEEIEELERGEGFPVTENSFNPIYGPTKLGDYPPELPPGGFPLPGPGFLPAPPNPNELDVIPFLNFVHAALAPNVNGYALRVRKDGQTVGVLQWNWARNPAATDAPALGWNSDQRMHVASVSKFMSAIALAHLLENTPGVDGDSLIWPFLPAYWTRNAGATQSVTFDDLLDHRSGFSTGGSSSNWQTMKSNVEAGANGIAIAVESFDYENMNFGLIRILIATLAGYIDPSTDFGFLFNDMMWDNVTWLAYNDYLQTYVFGPVAATPTIDKNLLSVLAYRFNGTGPGWNTGNWQGSSGGAGWHMTINEVLDVTRAFYEGNLLSNSGAVELRTRSWGLNSPIGGEPTAAGNIYYKAGLWTDNGNNPAAARTEQCFVLFCPAIDVEIAVFVNSEIGANGASLTNLIRQGFINNIFIP